MVRSVWKPNQSGVPECQVGMTIGWGLPGLGPEKRKSLLRQQPEKQRA